jgi:hypothetical protein
MEICLFFNSWSAWSEKRKVIGVTHHSLLANTLSRRRNGVLNNYRLLKIAVENEPAIGQLRLSEQVSVSTSGERWILCSDDEAGV